MDHRARPRPLVRALWAFSYSDKHLPHSTLILLSRCQFNFYPARFVNPPLSSEDCVIYGRFRGPPALVNSDGHTTRYAALSCVS